jgi:hypothetical protein
MSKHSHLGFHKFVSAIPFLFLFFHATFAKAASSVQKFVFVFSGFNVCARPIPGQASGAVLTNLCG